MALVTLDKRFPECCAIDTETWLSEVFHIDLIGELPEALANTLANDWVDECTADILAFIAEREGVDYTASKSDNTYNHENDFSSDFIFQYFVPEENNGDALYANGAYVAIQIHTGVDIRAGYTSVKLYKINDSLAESGFVDWLLSWNVDYANGDNADDKGEFSAGYHSNPGYHLLEDSLKGRAVWSDKRDCFLGVLKSNGRFVEIRPCYYGGDIHGSYDSKE